MASADAICISIGGNNCLHLMAELFGENNLFSIDAVEAAVTPMLQAAEADLDRIFTVLKEKNPTAPVLVQTLFEPFRYVTIPVAEGVTVADWTRGYIERYNTMLKTKAAEHGVLCVDVYEAFRTKGQESRVYVSLTSGALTDALNILAQGNPHPTKDGHRGIYDAYVEAAGEPLAALSAVEETVESTDGDVLTSESEVTTPESTYEGGSAPTKAWLPWVAVPLAAVVAVGIGILFKKKSK
jgi:lysophospholipase L1-like esterase